MVDPGTWHESNPEVQVAWGEAMAAWTDAVVPELQKVASHYGASITYSDLAEAIQARTGYRTRTQLANWIGKVLEVVVRRTMTEALPPLTSLVVHKDSGGVGDGYYNREHPQHTIVDEAQLQLTAAEDRLKCYRHYCATVPDDAAPQMTQMFLSKRAARIVGGRKDPIDVVCPRCFIAVPLTGVCDTCGWTK